MEHLFVNPFKEGNKSSRKSQTHADFKHTRANAFATVHLLSTELVLPIASAKRALKSTGGTV